MFKKIGITLASTAVVLMASTASADPITDWGWTLDSAWTAWSDGAGEDVTPGAPVAGIPGGVDTLSWGNPLFGSEQSSLEITNPNIVEIEGTANAFSLVDNLDGTWSDTVEGTLAFHHNNVIGGNSLISTTLTDIFSMSSSMFPGVVGPLASAFDILFKETDNSLSAAACSWSANPSNLCDDIFVVTNPGDLNIGFTLLDYNYTLSIGALGLGPLSDAACGAAGAASGCIGLVTQENESNPFQFEITLTASNVPEPSMMILMGLGLMGFGLRRRKRAA